MSKTYHLKLESSVKETIRERLTAVSGGLTSDPGNTSGSDPVRAGARAVGVTVAKNFEKFWKLSEKEGEGPIDVIDMFSGCGGMSAGFRVANALIPAFRHILAVDIDSVANASYQANFGTIPANISVHDLARNRRKLRKLLRSSKRRDGHPLILIGCAPCQGFSSHRNSVGEGDERNSLFTDFAEIATYLQPDAVVVENVPELLTTKYWPYVEKARLILERRGYVVHLSVHNMAEFGVPQERYRALLLAFRKNFYPLQGFLTRNEFSTVREAIGLFPAIRAGEKHPEDPMHYTAGHQPSTLETIRAIPHDGGNRPPDVGPACLRRIHERQGKAAYEDVYGRLYWDRPSITITAYARNPASGRFVHPEQDRGLSVREAATLQGFPTNFLFEGSLDQRFRQIGNAVPPPFAAYLATHILGELLAPAPVNQPTDTGVTEPIGESFSRLIPSLKAGTGRYGNTSNRSEAVT